MSEANEVPTKRPEMDWFLNKETSDVTLVVGEKRFPAFKLILGLKSRVFRAMFSGQFKESNDKEVVIKDTTYDAFEIFLNLFYSEKHVFKDNIIKDLQIIHEVCKLCDRYDTPSLFHYITDHLMTFQLSLSDMTSLKSITRIAFDYKLKEMMTKVMTFIELNIKQLINKSDDELIQLDVFTRNRLVKVMADNNRELQKQIDDPKLKCLHCQTINVWQDIYAQNSYKFIKCTKCNNPFRI